MTITEKNYIKDVQETLYSLKIFYTKLLELLEVFCTSYFGIRSPKLNHYYTKLLTITNSLLELPCPEFKKLLSQRPHLPESLIGDIEDFDISWKHDFGPATHEFNSKVEQLFLQTGGKTFPLDKDTKDFLKGIDKAIKTHKEINEAEMDRLTFGSKILVCGRLELNLRKATLRYKDFKPVEISPDTNEIKLLSFLMQAKRLVKYKEIAKKLDLNCYHPDYTNKQHARDIQFLRRDLNPILEKAGMTRKEINKMITAKKNTGYKLHCIR